MSTAQPTTCPCGGGLRAECCGPFLDGERRPDTAEQLMRSRYSAFVEGKVGYIKDTLSEEARKTHDDEGVRKWAQDSKWLGLEIVGTSAGGPSDDEGTVEFIARYRADGRVVAHHEVARFAREQGRWVFADSDTPKPATFRRDAPKVHRNDPCPCGSGKKNKKCCGA